jgi:hypothetical protein
MSVTIRTELKWNGDKVLAREEAAAQAGVHDAAQHLLGVSQQRVPLEVGTLQSTGRVIGTGLRQGVSYDTVYARRQHEELTWRHRPGRTAKYLEGPLTEESATMQAIIAAKIREALS